MCRRLVTYKKGHRLEPLRPRFQMPQLKRTPGLEHILHLSRVEVDAFGYSVTKHSFQRWKWALAQTLTDSEMKQGPMRPGTMLFWDGDSYQYATDE